MDPDPAPAFRRTVAADLPGAYRVFRRSLFDYLYRAGQVDKATASDPPVESGWATQRGWMEHLAATAAEDWVAEGQDGEVIGWAQSIERDGLLELTLFFVDPRAQARGIGRELLDRAFPRGRGSARAIVATQDPRALSLYLRYDVKFVSTSVDMMGRPAAISVPTDLVIERIDADDECSATMEIAGIERALLGHTREQDTRFLLNDRPAWLARRGHAVVGIAFGTSGSNTGPIAALEPSDLPALLGVVETDAAGRALEEIGFTVPMSNATAMEHLLARRFQIDPFYTFILASDTNLRLDRWIHTGPAFIL